MPARLWFALAIIFSAGCSKPIPPEVKGWYTTSGPLKMNIGEIWLKPGSGSKRVFVIVDAQFDGTKVWTATGKKEGFQYGLNLKDFHLLTADGQSPPPEANQSGEFWSPGGHSCTDNPKEYSRWTFAFAIDEKAVGGGLKIQVRDQPPMELAADTRLPSK